MTSTPTLFHRSIAHALSSWPALQTCVRQGAGGRDSAAKAEWLVGATEQWMTENEGIEPRELAEFYQDVFWNEFDTVVDDGSLDVVSKSICDFQAKIKRGLLAEVEAAIKDAPRVDCPVSVATDEGEDDDDEADLPTPARAGVLTTDSSRSPPTLVPEGEGQGDEESMEVDEETNDGGWTVVKKGGKKRNV